MVNQPSHPDGYSPPEIRPYDQGLTIGSFSKASLNRIGIAGYTRISRVVG